jgi:hypothetical protein
MEVGIIAPLNYLNLCSTNLHMAYVVFCQDKNYFNFYRNSRNVILDYSPALPRTGTSSKYPLTREIKYIHPRYVILPSIDYSWERTLLLAQDVASTVGPAGIGVLQGTNLDTLRKCYIGLKEICDKIALPSIIETIGRRDEIIRDLGIKTRVIYLEVYRNPYEEIPPEGSMGIVTSFPLRLAQESRELISFNPSPKPLNFMAGSGQLREDLAKSNIEDYVKLVKGEKRVLSNVK